MSHTPGPWDDASQYPEFPTVRIFAGTHYIATVGNPEAPRAETEANSRLIATAPDLLEACRLAEDFITHAVNWPLGTRIAKRPIAINALLAAIAKAEGRS